MSANVSAMLRGSTDDGVLTAEELKKIRDLLNGLNL